MRPWRETRTSAGRNSRSRYTPRPAARESPTTTTRSSFVGVGRRIFVSLVTGSSGLGRDRDAGTDGRELFGVGHVDRAARWLVRVSAQRSDRAVGDRRQLHEVADRRDRTQDPQRHGAPRVPAAGPRRSASGSARRAHPRPAAATSITINTRPAGIVTRPRGTAVRASSPYGSRCSSVGIRSWGMSGSVVLSELEVDEGCHALGSERGRSRTTRRRSPGPSARAAIARSSPVAAGRVPGAAYCSASMSVIVPSNERGHELGRCRPPDDQAAEQRERGAHRSARKKTQPTQTSANVERRWPNMSRGVSVRCGRCARFHAPIAWPTPWIAAPEHEGPRRAVPEPAEDHRQDEVHVRARLAPLRLPPSGM